jgi:hypothetical protein
MIILLVITGLLIYLAFGVLTAIAGLRSGDLTEYERGPIFGAIMTWPGVWFLIALITVVDRIKPSCDSATNKFIQLLSRIAKSR